MWAQWLLKKGRQVNADGMKFSILINTILESFRSYAKRLQ